MIQIDEYFPFIVAVYGAAVLIIGGIAWQSYRAYLSAKREYDSLERGDD